MSDLDGETAEQIELAEVPWFVSEEIASWRRILHLTQGDRRSNFERACAELMALSRTHSNAPEVKNAIVDSLFDMGRTVGMADDEAQGLIAAKSAVAEHGAKPPNGHTADLAAVLVEIGAAPRFAPISIDDVRIDSGPAWLVRGILPARGLACVVGPPKSRKSFFATDMLFSVARGTPYAGREIMPGPVIYLTGEGVTGFKRRLVAMRRHYGVEGRATPFFMVENVPDLGSERTDLDQLLGDLDGFLSAAHLERPKAIVLDTLARCMGSGDENTARDMGRFVDRCGAIERHFGCLVVVVHHMGKNPAAGGRGSNALNGAADVTLTVEKADAFSTVRVEEMKDGVEGQEWRFRLVLVDLNETSDTPSETSTETTTCVVELLSEPSEAKPSETKIKRPIRGVQGDLLKVIKRAIDEAGERNIPDALVPTGAVAVDRVSLRRFCRIMAWQDQDEKPDAFRAMLNKTLSQLRAADAVAFTQDWIWIP